MITSITKSIGIFGIFFLLLNGYFRLTHNPGIDFIVTNLLIIAINTTQIIFNKYNFSLKNIVCIFILFFFGLSPLYQVNNDFYVWGYYLNYTEVITANIAILYCTCAFVFFSRPITGNKNLNSTSEQERKLSAPFNKRIVIFLNSIRPVMPLRVQIALLLLSQVLFYLFFKYYYYNLLGVLFRGGIYEPNFDGNATEYLLISYFVRPIIFNIFLFAYFYGRVNKLILALLFILAIVAIFPTGVPRFFAAVIYLTLFTIIMLKNLRLNISLLFILSIALIFIFPFLDIFRWFSNDRLNNYEFVLDLYSGNFDAYGMFALALSKGVVVYGANILTAIFFFVPRFLWPSKELGSGATISGQLDLSLDNISMPYFAEGYLAFGIIGLLLSPVLLARIVYFIDSLFYKKAMNNLSADSPFQAIAYFNLMYLLFFMLRGDFLSSYAYMCGILCANFLINRYIKLVNKLKA